MFSIGNGSIFNAIPKAKVALLSLDPIFASEDDQRKKEGRMVFRSTSMIFIISTSFHFWLSVLMNHQKGRKVKEGCCRFDLDQNQDRWLRLDIPTMYPRWKYVLVNLSKTCQPEDISWIYQAENILWLI